MTNAEWLAVLFGAAIEVHAAGRERVGLWFWDDCWLPLVTLG